MQPQELLQKIASLPQAQLIEVETFVERMRSMDSDRRKQLADEISLYAEAYAGSEIDLDQELERSSTEHLIDSEN